MQTLPAPSRIVATVLIDTSQTREIDRMDDPSQSIESIWTTLSLRESLCGN